MRSKWTSLENIILFTSNVLILLYTSLGWYEAFSSFLKGGYLVSLSLLLLLFILNIKQYSIKKIIPSLVCFAFGGLIGIISKDYVLLKFFYFLIVLMFVRKEKLLKIDCITRVVVLATILLFVSADIIPNRTYNFNGTIRNCFGFSNPNTIGLFSLVFSLEFLFLFKNKVLLKTCVIILELGVFIFLINSRTTILMLLLSLSIYYIYEIFGVSVFKKKLVKNIMIFMPIFFLLIMVFGILIYRSGISLSLTLDSLLSGRISIASNFLEKYGFSIVGINLRNEVASLDNTYAYLGIALGIPTLIIFVYAYCKSICLYFEKSEISFAIILTVLIIYGVSEHLWINIDYNITIILLSISFTELMTVPINKKQKTTLNYIAIDI